MGLLDLDFCTFWNFKLHIDVCCRAWTLPCPDFHVYVCLLLIDMACTNTILFVWWSNFVVMMMNISCHTDYALLFEAFWTCLENPCGWWMLLLFKPITLSIIMLCCCMLGLVLFMMLIAWTYMLLFINPSIFSRNHVHVHMCWPFISACDPMMHDDCMILDWVLFVDYMNAPCY